MAFLNKIKEDPILPEPKHLHLNSVFVADTQNYTVSVENPRKIGEKNAYVAYTVKCTRKSDDTSYTVDRRYSDFDWLCEHLKLVHPSCVVPQIPEKSISSNFDEGLMAFRARELTRFMQRVLAHPLMSTDEAVLGFISMSEAEFADRRAQKDDVQKENFFSHLLRAATSVLGSQDDPDAWFKEKAEDILNREVLLTQMLQVSQRLILQYQQLIKDYSVQSAGLRGLLDGIDDANVKTNIENSCKAIDYAKELMEDMVCELSVTVSGNILDYIHELQAIHGLIERRAPLVRASLSENKGGEAGQGGEAQTQLDQFSNAARADIQQVCDLRNGDMERFFVAINRYTQEFYSFMAKRWTDFITNVPDSAAAKQ